MISTVRKEYEKHIQALLWFPVFHSILGDYFSNYYFFLNQSLYKCLFNLLSTHKPYRDSTTQNCFELHLKVPQLIQTIGVNLRQGAGANHRVGSYLLPLLWSNNFFIFIPPALTLCILAIIHIGQKASNYLILTHQKSRHMCKLITSVTLHMR